LRGRHRCLPAIGQTRGHDLLAMVPDSAAWSKQRIRDCASQLTLSKRNEVYKLMSRYSLLCLIALCFASLASGAAIADPVGDTFGSGPVQLDITSIDAVGAAGTLTFTLTFANTISPASSAAANSIFGFIDIDVDRNPLTGGGGSNQGTFGI